MCTRVSEWLDYCNTQCVSVCPSVRRSSIMSGDELKDQSSSYYSSKQQNQLNESSFSSDRKPFALPRPSLVKPKIFCAFGCRPFLKTSRLYIFYQTFKNTVSKATDMPLWNQCYLPPGCHQTQAITLARQAGTRFTYPGGMEGWVDLGVEYVPIWFKSTR